MWCPYADELLELVNTKLSPYKEVFTRSDLDIMTVNADGSVSSSTGHVEDSNGHPSPVLLAGPVDAPGAGGRPRRGRDRQSRHRS